VPLLDALRALCAFDPPAELPPCDLDELAGVLDAHGLAPLASWQLEHRPIGARVPMAFRERLLPLYQGVVNDNVFRMMTLKGLLRGVTVPAVALDGAAYVDWLYPHLAWRPVGTLRLLVRGADGEGFAEEVAPAGFGAVSRGPGGHTATFSDGRVEVILQEGLVSGREDDQGLLERAEPYRVVGPSALRPTAPDALLASVADAAAQGLQASLLAWIDLRELCRRIGPEADGPLRARAQAAGLSRALHGAMALVAHFFPEVAERARALSPPLGGAGRLAVEAAVSEARDPARLRRLRGSEELARLLLSPT